MRSTNSRIVLALALFAGIASLSAAAAQDGYYEDDHAGMEPAGTELIATITPSQVAFQQAMRSLWDDHVAWTRLFVNDFAADSPSVDATTQRLLRNQIEIGDAIKPFYGDEADTKLTELLTGHILDAADLLAAAKSGDAAATDAATERWYANGDQIAAFLHAANPTAWPSDDLRAMMAGHLDQTLAEAVAHLSGDWNADFEAYDVARSHMLAMADKLSAGIISQFTEQFAQH